MNTTSKTRIMVRIAILAALIYATNLATAALSFNIGPLNIRVADSLAILIYHSGWWACLAFIIGNVLSWLTGSTLGLIDLFWGALFLTWATSVLMIKASPNRFWACLWGSLVTGIGVGWMLNYTIGLPLVPIVSSITASSAVTLFGIGNFVITPLAIKLGDLGLIPIRRKK